MSFIKMRTEIFEEIIKNVEEEKELSIAQELFNIAYDSMNHVIKNVDDPKDINAQHMMFSRFCIMRDSVKRCCNCDLILTMDFEKIIYKLTLVSNDNFVLGCKVFSYWDD